MISLTEISKHKPSDWYIEQTTGRPFILSGITPGFCNGLKLRDYSIILSYFKEGEFVWITLIEDQNNIAAKIFEKHKENKNYWKNEFQNWLEIKKRRLEENFHNLRKKDLSAIPNEELIEDMKRYFNLQLETRKISSLADPFEFFSERELIRLLEELAKKDHSINPRQAFELLTKQEEPSFLNLVELELIDITKEILKDSSLKRRFLSDVKEDDIVGTEVYKKIKKHLDKFVWLKVESFFGGKNYTFKDVIDHIKKLMNLNIEEEEKKNRLWEENKKLRKNYILKHKLNEEIIAISELSPLFGKLQDQRKENTLITTYLCSKYLKELSKRTGIKEDYLAYLDYSEIDDLMNKKLESSILKKRKEGCLFVFKKDKFKVFYENEIKKIIENILNLFIEDTSEFSGLGVSLGKARGKVKIIIKQEDIPKMRQGDILVSTMTRPEHTVAMKKAAAIITNEGGITCHAAIVSRELGIPCIIGTKIATKVLKDGVLVEVDADKGVVKIIK